MLDVTTAVPRRAVVLVLAAAAFAALLQGGHCYVQLGSYTSLENSPPVTNWLLTQSEGSSTITGVQGIPSSQRAAWKRIGAKIWWFLSNMDHDFMMSGKTAPPSLPGAQRAYGTSVSCGSFARKFVSGCGCGVGCVGWLVVVVMLQHVSLRQCEKNALADLCMLSARASFVPCWCLTVDTANAADCAADVSLSVD